MIGSKKACGKLSLQQLSTSMSNALSKISLKKSRRLKTRNNYCTITFMSLILNFRLNDFSKGVRLSTRNLGNPKIGSGRPLRKMKTVAMKKSSKKLSGFSATGKITPVRSTDDELSDYMEGKEFHSYLIRLIQIHRS